MNHGDPGIVAAHAHEFARQRFTHLGLFRVLRWLDENERDRPASRAYEQHTGYLADVLPDYGLLACAKEASAFIQLPITAQYGSPRGVPPEDELTGTGRYLANQWDFTRRERQVWESAVKSYLGSNLATNRVLLTESDVIDFAYECDREASIITRRKAFLSVLMKLARWNRESDAGKVMVDMQFVGFFAQLLLARGADSTENWVDHLVEGVTRDPQFFGHIANPDERETVGQYRLYPRQEWVGHNQPDWFDKTMQDYIAEARDGNVRALADVLVALDPPMDFDLRRYLTELPGEPAEEAAGGW